MIDPRLSADLCHWRVPPALGRVEGVPRRGHDREPQRCRACLRVYLSPRHWAVAPDADPRTSIPFHARGTAAPGHSRDVRNCPACDRAAPQEVQILLALERIVRRTGSPWVRPIPDLVLEAHAGNPEVFGMPPAGDGTRWPHSQLVLARMYTAVARRWVEYDDEGETSYRRVRIAPLGEERVEAWRSQPK